jgi:IPT/TIG domain-containing protein
MSKLLSTRCSRAGSILAATLLGTAGAVVATAPQAAMAVTTPPMTITTVAPATVAAAAANKVVTITGTGFDEEYISKIALGADPACDHLTSYVVVSATSISVKTPTGGCLASSAAEPVTIYDSSDPTTPGSIQKAAAITFVSPPTLVTGENDATPANNLKPVVTENSAGLLLVNQVNTLQVAAGQVIRVKASPTFAFSNNTTNKLTATLGGKALTDIKVYSITPLSGPVVSTAILGSTENGNYLTAKVPALAAGTVNALVISQNLVSSTFTAAYTGLTWTSAPTVTALDVTSGRSTGGTVVKITGTGFNPTVGSYDGTVANILVCGMNAVPTLASTTSLTFATPAAGGAALGLGTSVFEGPCPVKVMNTVTNIGTSVVTDKSNFVYLSS